MPCYQPKTLVKRSLSNTTHYITFPFVMKMAIKYINPSYNGIIY